MNRVKVLAFNTFSEALRMKVLYVVLFLAFILILITPRLPSFNVGVKVTLFKDISLGFSALTLSVLALALSIGQVQKEVEKRTIYHILSKPISRKEVVTGKYLGVALTLLLISTLIGGLIFILEILIFRKTDFLLFLGVYTIFLESLVISAFGLFCSTFATLPVSTFLVILFYFIGHIKNEFLSSFEKGSFHLLYSVLKFLLPSLENFNINDAVAHNVKIPLSLLLQLSLYALVFIIIFLLLASFIFEAKDL
jgi:ABC-type transport system involved in multi-copper enzyme maturation permease subunit